MPRFFFDTFDGEKVIRDQDGEDFTSVEAAEVEAEDGARELAASVIVRHGLMDSRELRVRDSNGAVIHILRFRDFVEG